ncbi:hypothetical protein TruAng_009506 [Truncatella angustata]|nr:hypothetical protein TruAng_009506 [Truncatella angustata]
MDTVKETPKYTTVGSIANTNTTPLQPPTRRGRTAKWPLPVDFGLLTSPTSGFSLGSGMRSPPPADARPLHYSPLRQNTDRAMSPTMDRSSLTASSVSFVNIISARAATLDKEDETSMTSKAARIEAENLDDHTSMKQLSVKSLTNLASYENPKQKIAQKILSRARSTPLQPTRAYSDQISVASMLQSDGTAEHRNDSTASSILSRGPGAPRPLTAGPPGLRQRKSCPTEPVEKGSIVEALANTHTMRQDAIPAVVLESDRASLRNVTSSRTCLSSVREVLRADGYSSSKMVDTLSAEEARVYYQQGLLPANFNFQTQPSATTIERNSSTDECTSHMGNNKKNHISRSAVINALWNEGTEMLGKSINEASYEHTHRDFEKLMGIESNHKEIKPKTVLPKISVQQADLMSIEEHAAPLLSIAFQTLVGSEMFTLSGNLPKLRYQEI